VTQVIPTRVRLGGFEVNLETGELCPFGDAGGSLLLREQPFQILKMLIDRGGKIVTREEIRKKLWPNDTVVNFDQGINAAIRILRRALNDSADSPRYIETLARRGYRLLVAIEPLKTQSGLAQPNNNHEHGLRSSDSLVGKRVSHYRVLEIIGGGGMGVVYKAEDLRLGRRVALKFLPEEFANDPIALRRFEREAQTASALNHPNICTIYEIEEHASQPFIVMELLEGESLHHHLSASASKTMAIPELFEMALQICGGLQAAHDKGIIHRDIKPANIFLTKQGQAKILDFGLAKLTEHEEAVGLSRVAETDSDSSPMAEDGDRSSAVNISLTLTGPAMGTAGYMSPEQVRREKLDCTTDLFSFGLVMFEALTGRRAFEGETASVVHDGILRETPPPPHQLNPNCSRKFSAVIAKALEKERARRYQSAAEMRQALERVGRETQSAQRRKLAWLAASLLLGVVLTGIWIYWRYQRPIRLSRGNTVVLAVANRTNDPVFDDAAYTAMYFGLQQTPYIHVLEREKLLAALQDLHIPLDVKKTPDIGRQVCLKTNSSLEIATLIFEEGNGFRIEQQGVDCRTGRVAARVLADADNRTQVIHALGVSTAQLRAKLGEPEDSIRSFNQPLDQAISSSPEAIQLLTEGYNRTLAGDPRGGVSNYQRAITLDPGFAMALSALGAAEEGMGSRSLATATDTRAYALRDRVTLPVRFQIEEHYYRGAIGDLNKDYSTLTQWVQLFPDDFVGHNNFANCLGMLGQQDQSLAESREAARLFPSPWSYNDVILRDVFTDRYREAKAMLDDADAHKFDSSELHDDRMVLAFLQHDEPEMQKQWNWALERPEVRYRLIYVRGLAELFSGHYRNYLRFLDQAITLADKRGDQNNVAGFDDIRALELAEIGNLAQSRKTGEKALSITHNLQSQAILALALARAGDIADAQRLVDEINREALSDTIVQNSSLSAIRAAMRLQTNDPAGAIELLRPALHYEFARPGGITPLYPTYIRGLAYLQLGDGHHASAEFQKVIDHPGLIRMDVIGALSHLQMARAQKLAGDKSAALQSYADFLDLWKSADPDIPIYKQAKAEYGRLKENRLGARN
jgi:eukaryotic-like serine/threonine-protein kinase